MINKLIILGCLLLFASCNENQFILLVEDPYVKELNDKSIHVYLDEVEIYESKIKSTNITPSYNEFFYNADEGSYKLKVLVDGISFEYDLEYPKDKFVIISPTYLNGKIDVGILKKDRQIALE